MNQKIIDYVFLGTDWEELQLEKRRTHYVLLPRVPQTERHTNKRAMMLEIKQRQLIAIHPVPPCAKVSKWREFKVTGQRETVASDWSHNECTLVHCVCKRERWRFSSLIYSRIQDCWLFFRGAVALKVFYFPAPGLTSARHEVRTLFSFSLHLKPLLSTVGIDGVKWDILPSIIWQHSVLNGHSYNI